MPESADQRPRAIRTARLEAFSDGVFAIAITLLVLDIAVPEAVSGDPFSALKAEWPSYLAYVVSFATVGAIWLGHSAITEYLSSVDSTLMRLNLLLLLVVSFLPFPTRLLGEWISSEDSERAAVTIYGLTLLAATSTLALLWRYALTHDLLDKNADQEDLDLLTERLTPGLVAYAVLLLVGWFFPKVTLVGYLVLALLFILPFHLRRGHRHA